MALQNTVSHLKELLSNITQDIGKAEGGNKAAAQRVRTQTVKFEKIAKTYRKESISNEKHNKGKKPAKKAFALNKSTALKGRAAPSKAKAAPKKQKPKAKAATARPRALSLKRPTARLPVKRASFR